jgi:RNA polymerase sigma-70 factor (ECF subfamily)
MSLMSTIELDSVVVAATAGDESAFSELVERHRRELQAHAYRIVGSREDAEDLTQETFLRAWRMRESFQGRASFRAWLYRIATNTCLSALERRSRRPQGVQSPGALEAIPAADAEPDEVLVTKETAHLAVLAAVQHLPPRQRAVLIVRDVLGWPAKETAALLGTSVASVTSAHQRARSTLREKADGAGRH